jgi:hypothetical protein
MAPNTKQDALLFYTGPPLDASEKQGVMRWAPPLLGIILIII